MRDGASGVDGSPSRSGREGRSKREPGCSRGQTPVDYLIGISLVLVTILGVFVLVPTVFDPFEPAVSPDTQSMADRLADDLVTNHTYPGEERTLNLTEMNGSIQNDLDRLRADAGITERERANVTVQNGTGSQVVTAGDRFPTGAGRVAASVRTFTTHGQDCTDGCRLIVRVWTR